MLRLLAAPQFSNTLFTFSGEGILIRLKAEYVSTVFLPVLIYIIDVTLTIHIFLKAFSKFA